MDYGLPDINDLNIHRLTEAELGALKKRAKKIFQVKVAYFADKMNITYGRIAIRQQRTRWGSCSNDGNLNFNYLLLLMPNDIIDYVIVHELAHRIEFNHSALFWSEVEKVLPDYKIRKKWLKDNGSTVMHKALC